MTPKEKAKELVDKMWVYSLPNANGSWNNAKRCALIAVDELIKETGKRYWYDVKTEIEKL